MGRWFHFDEKGDYEGHSSSGKEARDDMISSLIIKALGATLVFAFWYLIAFGGC
jgi:hypothetical protein